MRLYDSSNVEHILTYSYDLLLVSYRKTIANESDTASEMYESHVVSYDGDTSAHLFLPGDQSELWDVGSLIAGQCLGETIVIRFLPTGRREARVRSALTKSRHEELYDLPLVHEPCNQLYKQLGSWLARLVVEKS